MSGRPRVRLWQGYLAFAAVGAFLYLLVPPLKGNAAFFKHHAHTSCIAVIE
ncbi:MAG: hypothetical protein ACHQDY_06970 [Solirubrobacterales bacterium]